MKAHTLAQLKDQLIGAEARMYDSDWIVRMGARKEVERLKARIARKERAEGRRIVKNVDWAYPSSESAHRFGCGSVGCWVVNLTTIDTARDRSTTKAHSGGYKTAEEAAGVAIELPYEWASWARTVGQARSDDFSPMNTNTTEVSAQADKFFGKDCPKGMVQVEFVGCRPEDRIGDYGWKPTPCAFLEVYVDGKRFRITVGDFHDSHGPRRGLQIITESALKCEQTAINEASVSIPG